MNPSERPSLREAARRGVEANRQAKQAAPPPPAPPPEPKAARPKVPAVAKASCGHDVSFEAPDKPANAESKRRSIER